MHPQITIGLALASSRSIINTPASLVGVAKTGTPIGTLGGAAFTNATAAWVGLGSMNTGLFLMNALPIVGALLILDSLSGRDHGSPIIDWYEQAWRNYEVQCELEDLKQQIKVDPNYQVGAKTRFSQLESCFRLLEAEHELDQLKKEMGLLSQSRSSGQPSQERMQQIDQVKKATQSS